MSRWIILVLVSVFLLSDFVEAQPSAGFFRPEDFEEFDLDSVMELSPEDDKLNVYYIDDDVSLDASIYISADGKPGRSALPSWSYGSTPESGSSASSGGFITVILRRIPELVVVTARGGRGGDGAHGAWGRPGREGVDGRKAGFFRKATPGTNGGDGGDGGNGSHGGHGGSGGNLRIVYAPYPDEDYVRDWQDHVEVKLEGGIGGDAGYGGPGGVGGQGGRGGKKFWSRKRKADGLDGRPGRRGVDGIQGEDGERGQVEFIESESLADFVLDDFLLSIEES